MDASISGKDEELIAYAAKQEHRFKTVDLTDKVMNRIRQESGGQESAGKGGRLLRPATAAAGLLGIILIASVSGYAATKIIEIRDQSGKVVMKTIDYPHYPPDQQISRSMADYWQRVLDTLKPGELAAYYINDDQINSYDKLNPIKFAFQPISYTAYPEFLAEQARTDAPPLRTPDYLPEGIQFGYGQVHPYQPNAGGGEGSEYSRIKQRLMERASSSRGTDRLFTEKVTWKRSNHTQIYLTDLSGKIALTVLATYAIGSDVWPAKGDVVEKVTIGRMEGIYRQAPEGDGWRNSLAWFDSNAKIAYSIISNMDSKPSKEEMIEIAESMAGE